MMLIRASPLRSTSAGSGFDQSSTISGTGFQSRLLTSWLKLRRAASRVYVRENTSPAQTVAAPGMSRELTVDSGITRGAPLGGEGRVTASKKEEEVFTRGKRMVMDFGAENAGKASAFNDRLMMGMFETIFTKPVKFDVEFSGTEVFAPDQSTHAGFTATGQIKRSEVQELQRLKHGLEATPAATLPAAA